MTLYFLVIAHCSYDRVFTLQGGDEIDDIFGCSTVDGQIQQRSVAFADTLNVAGGDRQNVGDSSGEVNFYCLIAHCVYSYTVGIL